MIWFDALVAVIAGLFALHDFEIATKHGDNGNMAGMLWRGAMGVFFAVVAIHNGAQVAQYMGWM